MKIVPLRDHHKEWVQARTQHPWVEDSAGYLVFRDAIPMGAFILDSFTKNSASVHFCLESSMAIKSGILHAGFTLAYTTLGLGILYGGIPATNIPMRKLAEHVGFTPIGSLENAIGLGIDRIVYQMLRDECAWKEQEVA